MGKNQYFRVPCSNYRCITYYKGRDQGTNVEDNFMTIMDQKMTWQVTSSGEVIRDGQPEKQSNNPVITVKKSQKRSNGKEVMVEKQR